MGASVTLSQNYTNSLPQYAQPYYEQFMADAERIFQNRAGYVDDNGQFVGGYQPYNVVDENGQPIERLAGPSWQENAARMAREEMFTNPNTGYQDYARGMMNTAAGIPGQLQSQQGGIFGPQSAAQYTNPYQQSVTDFAIDRLKTQTQQDMDRRNAQTNAMGGRGGYRQALMDATSQGDLARNIGQIQATSGLEGWQNAQQQFERDRAARMGAVSENNQNLFGVMEGSRGLAETGLGLGGMEQQLNLQNIAQMETAGMGQRADTQRYLDMKYNDWNRQENWIPQQMSQYMGLMSGVPIQMDTATRTQSPAPVWRTRSLALA